MQREHPQPLGLLVPPPKGNQKAHFPERGFPDPFYWPEGPLSIAGAGTTRLPFTISFSLL